MHFLIGSNNVIFRIRKFGLVTGFNYGVPPLEADIKEKASPRRILINYFNDSDLVKFESFILALTLSIQITYFILSMQHIDEAIFLKKKCLWNFSKTFSAQVRTVETLLTNYIRPQHDKFQRNLTKYRWDQEVMNFVKGRSDWSLSSWKVKKVVYFILHVHGNNWVLCKVKLYA